MGVAFLDGFDANYSAASGFLEGATEAGKPFYNNTL
jgi:hypothetical protein